MRPGSLQTKTAIALLLLTAAAGALDEPWKLVRPAPVVKLTPERIEKSETLACAQCHAAVVAEWGESAHAVAWQDHEYREQLSDMKRPEGCYGCHVPKPLFQQKDPAAKPPAREELREHGVTCESCHAGEGGVMLGPRGAATPAHASKKSEAFVGAGSTALCSSCHRVTIGPVVGLAKDFEQSKQAERGRSCVGCHCAQLELEFTKGEAQEGLPPGKRSGRSHLLQTPRDPTFLRRAFALELRQEKGQTVLVIKNQAGHRVPGLIGRKLTFDVRALDGGGKELCAKKLVVDSATYLPVDGSRDLPLGVQAAEVRVTGMHDEPRADAAVKFLEQTLKP